MLPVFLLAYAASVFYASGSGEEEAYGRQGGKGGHGKHGKVFKEQSNSYRNALNGQCIEPLQHRHAKDTQSRHGKQTLEANLEGAALGTGREAPVPQAVLPAGWQVHA